MGWEWVGVVGGCWVGVQLPFEVRCKLHDGAVAAIRWNGFDIRLGYKGDHVLYCIIQYCIVLYFTMLNCTVLYCTLQYSTAVDCIELEYTLILCSCSTYITRVRCLHVQHSRKWSLLHCTVLYCTVLYCTVLYCTVLYPSVLYCTVLYCTVLYCTVLYLSVLYCTV